MERMERIIRIILQDRKSTRLNSSHQIISYAVFCLKKKKNKTHTTHNVFNHIPDNIIASVSILCSISLCLIYFYFSFFFNNTATTEIYTLSLHDALPIYPCEEGLPRRI